VYLTPEGLVAEFQRRAIEWGREHYESWPWRSNRTPYRVLIAEFLLKRTTRRAVGRVYPEFIERFPDTKSLYRASLEEVVEALRPLGLYNQRAEQLKELARAVVEVYHGRIPNTLEELKGLPGVSDYIAGAVLSFGYGRPAPVADSNVLRIMSRVTGISSRTAAGKRRLLYVLERLVPEGHHVEFNYALLDLGGSVCHYRYPRCEMCPLKRVCVSPLTASGNTEESGALRAVYAKLADKEPPLK